MHVEPVIQIALGLLRTRIAQRTELQNYQKREGEKPKKEVIFMKQNQTLRNLFEDPSFLAEIEEARQFKQELCCRRRLEIPIHSIGSEQNG